MKEQRSYHKRFQENPRNRLESVTGDTAMNLLVNANPAFHMTEIN